MKKNYFVLIIILLFLINILSFISLENKYKEQSNLITAYKDTLRYIKTKEGKNAVTRQVLEGSRKELLNIVSSTNKPLYRLIKDKSNTSGTVVIQQTKYDTITKVRVDTVNSKPSFTDTLKNNWIELAVTLKNDSLKRSITLRDSISVSFKQVSNGFLKPKKNYVVVSNSNPYVKIGEVQSFQIPQKKSKSKFITGLIIGGVTGYLLFK